MSHPGADANGRESAELVAIGLDGLMIYYAPGLPESFLERLATAELEEARR